LSHASNAHLGVQERTLSTHKIFNIGIIGTGVIFDAYARGLGLSDLARVIRVADLDASRAAEKAAEWNIERVGTTDDLLADPDIDVVVNITPPAAHAAISRRAVQAGKHVYVEKPITLDVHTAQDLLVEAAAHGVVVGSAPDTFLGQAGQTARWAIDSGLIGRPFAATSFVTSSRTESWHPSPAAFYAPGAGPALDLGPYHLAHLVNLLGPVSTVIGGSSTPQLTLPVTAPNRVADVVEVKTPSHTTAILQMGEVLVTTMYSFEVWDAGLPFIEVYGTEGTIRMPKPNRFDEPVLIQRRGDEGFQPIAPVIDRTTPDPPTPFRALGVEDLIRSLSGEPHRTNGELAIHVLQVLNAVATISIQGGPRAMTTTVARPAPMFTVQPLAREVLA
jgi:predicted dehydrogenase